jgi:hypothetical protein
MLKKTKRAFGLNQIKHGYRYAVSQFLISLMKIIAFKVFNISISDSTSRTNIRLSKRLFNNFGGTVKYGPFAGMVLVQESSWGGKTRVPALLGFYEQEVLNELIQASSKYKNFIDLGAADGYYGVGVLVSGMFEKSFCYESSKTGRKAIAKNASVNRVSELVVIRGTARKGFELDFNEATRNESVLLVDIEGGEFDVLTLEVFEAFKKSVFIIEIHDWMVLHGEVKLQALEDRARKHFDIRKIRMGPRDPAAFPELKNFSDNERWLICSENRDLVQYWLILSPKRTQE